MPYVERDEAGAIKGCYATEQNGYAAEVLRDDDPEVLAFLQSQDELYAMATKRTAALKSLEEQRLVAAAADPGAPQAVKDYAAAIKAVA